MVELDAIVKRYGTTAAVDHVSLAVQPGELLTLLGPSGCGKTTLLKIIGGLIPASAGEVWVKGQRVTAPGPERAFVFQDFALLPWATVLRNVAFGLELRGVPKEERGATARQFIAATIPSPPNAPCVSSWSSLYLSNSINSLCGSRVLSMPRIAP